MSTIEQRICPDCGSRRTQVVLRGLTGPTDESDQYFRCEDCGRVTYEIVARTARELRIARISPGRQFRASGRLYEVRRVLKVGLDEYLVYLRPARDETATEVR
ncbi:MAG TPA: hypothetical protein VFU72_10080 [Nitrolancea sp.]|nr:hypothetical protein [Nitrolancea sp.]